MRWHHLRLIHRGRAILVLAGYDQRFNGDNIVVRRHVHQLPRILYTR